MTKATAPSAQDINGLLLTNIRGSNNECFRIAPLVHFIGIPFEYEDFAEAKPDKLIHMNELKHNLLIANYVCTQTEPSQYSINPDVMTALLRVAFSGSTVIVNDCMLYWLQEYLPIEYKRIERKTVVINSELEDRIKAKFQAKNFAVTMPSRKEGIHNLVLGHYEGNTTIIYAEIPYGKGKILMINSYLTRYLYSYYATNSVFLERIMKKLDEVLDSVLLFRFFGWKYGKEMAFVLRIDDIFPMLHPTLISNLKTLDKILIAHGLRATYAATPFGGEKWYPNQSVFSSIISKITLLMTKIPFLDLLPYRTYLFWLALWKALLRIILVSEFEVKYYLSKKSPLMVQTQYITMCPSKLRLSLNTENQNNLKKGFRYNAEIDAYEITLNKAFSIGRLKLVWTNTKTIGKRTRICINLANKIEDQFDPTFLDYLRSITTRKGFRIAIHGLKHWPTNLTVPHENEYYAASQYTSARSKISSEELLMSFTEAFNYLSEVFGSPVVERAIVVPWGFSYSITPELWRAARELGYSVHLTKWIPETPVHPIEGTVKLESYPIEDLVSSSKAKNMFRCAFASRGYFIAYYHAQSAVHSQLKAICILYQRNKDKIWNTTLEELSEYVHDRWRMLNPTLSKFDMNLQKLETECKILFRYNVPKAHTNHVVQINKRIAGKNAVIATSGKGRIIQTNKNFVKFEIQGSGNVEIMVEKCR